MSPLPDPTRRQILASACAFSGSLSLPGCVSAPTSSDSPSSSPDAPKTAVPGATTTRPASRRTDRPTIDRPTPSAPRPSGPEPYPSPPDSLDATSARATAYAYEGAWIANRLAGQDCVDSYTLAATVTDPEREVVERGRSALLVRIERPFGFSATWDDSVLHADGATEARYYVSTEAVVRVTGDDVTAPCR